MKQVKIAYEWWEATVEIEESEETTAAMKEQLLFWMGGQEMIDDADGNIEKAFLLWLGQNLIVESMRCGVPGILWEWKHKEGWAPLDGSCGVKLVSIESWQFSESDFYIEECQA